VTDFDAPAADVNALVGVDIDVVGFWDLVLNAYVQAAAGVDPQTPDPRRAE
jgi:hypothetical protein